MSSKFLGPLITTNLTQLPPGHSTTATTAPAVPGIQVHVDPRTAPELVPVRRDRQGGLNIRGAPPCEPGGHISRNCPNVPPAGETAENDNP